MEDNLVITAIVADHTTSTPTPLVVLQQHPNFTMVDMGMITWVVMGLGCCSILPSSRVREGRGSLPTHA